MIDIPHLLRTQIWHWNRLGSFHFFLLKYDPQIPSWNRLGSLHYSLPKYDPQIPSWNRFGSLHYFLLKYDPQIPSSNRLWYPQLHQTQIDCDPFITFYSNIIGNPTQKWSSNKLISLHYFLHKHFPRIGWDTYITFSLKKDHQIDWNPSILNTQIGWGPSITSYSFQVG